MEHCAYLDDLPSSFNQKTKVELSLDNLTLLFCLLHEFVGLDINDLSEIVLHKRL